MTTARKFAVFVLLTLAISLTSLAIAWNQGFRDMLGDSNLPPIFQLSIFGPGIAAVVCAILFERGSRMNALGLRFVPNRWWLAALLIPAALGAVYIATNLIAAGQNPLEPAGWTQALAAMAASDINGKFPNLAVAVVIMALVNTLSEELGWRGYLHHLWRPSGFVPAALGCGALQGMWHWPLVLLFGIGFTGNAAIDMAIYPLFTAMLGIWHSWLRERGRSVFAAGIFHGTFNVVASNSVGAGSYVVIALQLAGAVAICLSYRRAEKNAFNSSADSLSPMPT
jgi:uncharacterized protein